tara:strand:+ start:1112 stop:1459 length:348 start_codon:yes stop_codon:yes gene_type:complete
MAKKMRLEDLKGLAYSTDPDNIPDEDIEEVPALELSDQKLYVSLDKKQRGGKKVTLIEGFQGHEEDINQLGKALKKMCGAGGAVKNGEIIIQGDFRDKVVVFLQKEGYQVKRKGG